ncbi:unnamed protein product [Agarophyton chilense]|eukprot:gb/GEZJ01003411.1/.p1 GENE.gb/GEZJ01003411.1/~~gb/GEZJ01003411.1/.p1  ORF type:complete len:677 (-),score=62.93 gb/GEZJ01003411.1/:579-2609(-)
MFSRWASNQALYPFFRASVGSQEHQNPLEKSDKLGDLPLDAIGGGNATPFWVFSNIWDVKRQCWIIGTKGPGDGASSRANSRMPVRSWNDLPQFRMETTPAELKRFFAGKVVRTGSEDEFTSATEAFARDCFVWSLAHDISKSECDIIPSCWAATPVKTVVLNLSNQRKLNMSESVTEQILVLTELKQGDRIEVKSPRFLVLNDVGYNKEVDEEGVIWQEGIDSCYVWRISSDSPFVRASAMNTESPERLADRILRGAVSLMNSIKCLLSLGEANEQDYGQMSMWLENEGRWLADMVLNGSIEVNDGDYEVCVTKNPFDDGKMGKEGVEIEYVFSVAVQNNNVKNLQMSEKGLKGGSDCRRNKLNKMLREVMQAKRDSNLRKWLSQKTYEYVISSLKEDKVCYHRSPYRLLELIDAGLVDDHFNLFEKIFNGAIEIMSDEERSADHLGLVKYDPSDKRVILGKCFKGQKVSWKNETFKLFRNGLSGIAVKRDGKVLRSAKLGVLAAIHRVVHDTGALEGGLGALKWERADITREPETQIVLNSLLSGRLGVSGFTWAVAFLRDSGIRLTSDSACYLKPFHAENGGDYTVKQILKSSVLRRLEAVEFTVDGERCIGLDFDLPDLMLRLHENTNDATIVRRKNCSDVVKGRICSRFFVGGAPFPISDKGHLAHQFKEN